MNFNSRETYLNYRANWKAAYAQLTKDQQIAKLRVKTEARESGHASYAAIIAVNSNASTARRALEDLAEAKVEAQRQYLAAKT